jgi:hypothetical protein
MLNKANKTYVGFIKTSRVITVPAVPNEKMCITLLMLTINFTTRVYYLVMLKDFMALKERLKTKRA